jgi:hypothetical protein
MIKMAKSIQTTNAQEYTQYQLRGKLGLFIECRKCGYGRTYIIEEQLKLIATKRARAFNIEVECEKCLNVISVGIGFVEDTEGFSYRNQDFLGKKGVQVLDETGLKELRE